MVRHEATIGNGDMESVILSPEPMVFCAEDRIEELLRLPSVNGWCGGGRTAHLESIADPKRQRFARFSCGSWTCRVCSARKRTSAGRHYAMMLLLANGVLFERRYRSKEWDALRQGFQRSKHGPVSWVKIGCAGQPGIIIGCRPVANDWTVFSDREQAVMRLGEVLRDLVPLRGGRSSHCKPISCSQDWVQPKKPKRYRLLQWARVRSPEPLLRALGGFGIFGNVRQHNDAGVWDVTFEVPDGWSDSQRDALVSQIRCFKTED
jgi:hypothetical protein